MTILTISIDQLETGMYVVELDRSWLETPFFKHRFEIQPGDLEKLRQAKVREVKIDTDKGKAPAPVTLAASPADVPKVPEAPLSQAEALRQAVALRRGLRDTMDRLVIAARQDQPLELQSIEGHVDAIGDSLQRDPQSILHLVLTHKQGQAFNHHIFNTLALTLLLAEHLALSDHAKCLGQAAILKDIGWASLPPGAFDQAAVTDQERELLQRHVPLGVNLLRRSSADPDIIELVEQHHERMDGSGFPEGLSGGQLHPLLAPLILADQYGLMLQGVCGESRHIPSEALRVLYGVAMKPGRFPVSAVEALIRAVGIYPIHSAVLLNTGERGVITKVDWRSPLKPTVSVRYNARLMPLSRPCLVDLAQPKAGEPERKIQRTLNPTARGEDPAQLLVVLDGA
ncbi:putative Cyclic di-GMP phosphodiesterase PA4108 [Gammaproteobacteria bacterium]